MRKRRLWMAAALTFTVLLAGCGSKEEAVQTEAASTAAAAAEGISDGGTAEKQKQETEREELQKGGEKE